MLLIFILRFLLPLKIINLLIHIVLSKINLIFFTYNAHLIYISANTKFRFSCTVIMNLNISKIIMSCYFYVSVFIRCDVQSTSL